MVHLLNCTNEGCPKTLLYNFRSTKTKYNIICQSPVRASSPGARLAQGFDNAHGISFSVMSLREKHCEPNCARASSAQARRKPRIQDE